MEIHNERFDSTITTFQINKSCKNYGNTGHSGGCSGWHVPDMMFSKSFIEISSGKLTWLHAHEVYEARIRRWEAL